MGKVICDDMYKFICLDMGVEWFFNFVDDFYEKLKFKIVSLKGEVFMYYNNLVVILDGIIVVYDSILE